MKHILKLTSLVFLLGLTQLSQAQTANLSIQGIVKTIDATAVENGFYDLTFKLYDVPVAGSIIWEETIEEVKINGGIYSVVLGNVNPFSDIKFDKPYYLGVSVDGDIDLYPRARLTSSPYAMSLIGDDNIFPNSGNVGVGAANPTHKLTVKRGDGALGLEADETAGNTAVITTTADGMTLDAGGADKIYAFNNGRIAATADEQFTIEGTDNANLSFSKTGATASIGYDATNGNDLVLSNSNGNTNINGYTSINHNAETFRLQGTDHTYMAFFPFGESAGKKAFIGYPNANNTDLIINNSAANGNLALQATGGGVVHINDFLKVGGQTVPIYVGSYFFGNGNHHGDSYPANQTIDYSLRVTGGRSLFEDEINVLSDKRVKKDFKLSKGNKDLSLLKEIQVTDYRYIDEMQYGKEFKKGVLAQQVKEIYPEAVSQGVNFIPSIYTFPTEIIENQDAHTFTFEKAHQLKEGDLLKFIVGKNVVKATVSEIIDEHSFSISDWKDGTDIKSVFLYGHQVNDRLAVDYDEIFTLNVSATQELARQVEALKKENASLKDIVSDERQANANLKAEVKGMNARLQNIEWQLNSTGAQH